MSRNKHSEISRIHEFLLDFHRKDTSSLTIAISELSEQERKTLGATIKKLDRNAETKSTTKEKKMPTKTKDSAEAAARFIGRLKAKLRTFSDAGEKVHIKTGFFNCRKQLLATVDDSLPFDRLLNAFKEVEAFIADVDVLRTLAYRMKAKYVSAMLKTETREEVAKKTGCTSQHISRLKMFYEFSEEFTALLYTGQIVVDLSYEPTLDFGSTAIAVIKRALFVPMVSVMLGLTAGLISSFITKHSSFLHVQQEMVVLPCSNYIAYTVAQRMGLSPIIASIACELLQSTFCIYNVSEASKITYKSMLAKTSKLLGFFSSLSFGFLFGSVENRFLWKYVSLRLVLLAFGISILSRVLSALVAYFIVKRLGFKMHSNMVFLQLLIHTRSTPAILSLINLQVHSEVFNVCLHHLLCMQWSLYIMCTAMNAINVPLVGLLYKRFGIKPDLIERQAEPIFHVIFRLMYHEMNRQIAFLSGRRRRCEFASLLSSHVKTSFLRYVMSLGFMSVPERRSPILSAYDETISERSNVIDQRRRSLKSRDQIYATQVCARFLVKNLYFEGFHPDDIVEYFFTGGSV